jgi:hypothetical protein
MMVNPSTGLVTWTPTAASPADAAVVLLAYDARGANTAQAFNVQTIGVNRAPVFQPLPAEIRGQEGTALEISVRATDPEGDELVFWADRLPPGAVFDAERRVLSWVPDFNSAGTYANVEFG